MTFQLPVNYNDPEDFNYDENKVDIDPENGASVKIGPQDFSITENFEDDTGFTYDPTKAEFDAGAVKQIDQGPANFEAWITYLTNLNINVNAYNGPNVNGTSVNGASVDGGSLKLDQNDIRYVSYITAGNIQNSLKGAVKFKYTPNYSGAPGTNTGILCLPGPVANPLFNSIQIWHSASGQLRYWIYGPTGLAIADITLPVFSPVAGQEYEMELNFDIDVAGTPGNRFFIDGTQSGPTDLSTGTRNQAERILIGTNAVLSFVSNCRISDVIFFSQPQHTGDYIPGYELTETRYLEAKVDLPPYVYDEAGNVLQYESVVLTGAAKHIINGKYWDGLAWINSDGSYLQANTTLEVNTNLEFLTPSNTISRSIVFPAASTQSEVSQHIFSFVGDDYPTEAAIDLKALVGITELVSMYEDVTLNGGESKRVLLINGQAYWYDGAGWVASNLTLAQSNTIDEINANVATLPIVESAAFRYRTILAPSPSDVSPVLRKDFFDFKYQVPDTYEPAKTLVYGHLREISGFPDDATTYEIIAESKKRFFSSGTLIAPSRSSATIYEPDEYIYDFAWDLYASDNGDGYYHFSAIVTHENGTTSTFVIGKALIPVAIKANIADLSFE